MYVVSSTQTLTRGKEGRLHPEEVAHVHNYVTCPIDIRIRPRNPFNPLSQHFVLSKHVPTVALDLRSVSGESADAAATYR